MTHTTHPNTKVFSGLIDSYMRYPVDRAEIQQPTLIAILPQRAIARRDYYVEHKLAISYSDR